MLTDTNQQCSSSASEQAAVQLCDVMGGSTSGGGGAAASDGVAVETRQGSDVLKAILHICHTFTCIHPRTSHSVMA